MLLPTLNIIGCSNKVCTSFESWVSSISNLLPHGTHPLRCPNVCPVFQEIVHLDLPDISKCRRKGREHLVWYVLDTKRFLDVLCRNESAMDDSQVRRPRRTTWYARSFSSTKTSVSESKCRPSSGRSRMAFTLIRCIVLSLARRYQ